MKTKPLLSGRMWRAAGWLAAVLLLGTMLYTLWMLAQTIMNGAGL